MRYLHETTILEYAIRRSGLSAGALKRLPRGHVLTLALEGAEALLEGLQRAGFEARASGVREHIANLEMRLKVLNTQAANSRSLG